MRRLLPTVASVAVLGLCAFAPVAAHAQSIAAGNPGAARVEGPGISLGDRVVLHVGIGAELRYDSNVYYESSNTTQALALRLTPNFSIATRSGVRTLGTDGAAAPHKVDFRIGGGLDYREFLVSNTGMRPPRQFNILGNASLTILPSGPFTLELFDNFVRSNQPAYETINYNYDRDVNELGFRARIKPGGGRLELQLGYVFGIDLWETSPQDQYDNFYHRSTIRLLWKFLPKTSVYVQGENYVYQYRHPPPVETLPGGGTQQVRPDGYPLRVIAGLNGLLTAKLNFDLYAGYANGFYQSGPSPNTGIAGLSLNWRPYALASGTLAYRHDFINSLLGVYADVDNVSVSWTQQIWRFSGFLRLAYQNTRYQGITPIAGNAPVSDHRTDNGFTLNARVDYFAYKNWLALSLGYDFNLVRSDSQLGTVGVAGLTPVDFDKHEVYFNVSVLF